MSSAPTPPSANTALQISPLERMTKDHRSLLKKIRWVYHCCKLVCVYVCMCVCWCVYQCFFKSIYPIGRYENMGFRLLKSIWDQAFGGVDEPLCKMVLWPLEGLRRPHTPQIPNIPSHQVKMSDKPPSKKPKVSRGESDGKYLRAHGPTNKFQAQWLEH